MKTFEYSILKLDNSFTAETKLEQLSELGEEGWELITILPNNNKIECFMKREIDTIADQAKEKLEEAIGAIKGMAGGIGGPGGLGDILNNIKRP